MKTLIIEQKATDGGIKIIFMMEQGCRDVASLNNNILFIMNRIKNYWLLSTDLSLLNWEFKLILVRFVCFFYFRFIPSRSTTDIDLGHFAVMNENSENADPQHP
jgi:hypothetical protein